MSEDLESVESDTDILCCASCGIAEVDDIKLKDCDACKLIRYCVMNGVNGNIGRTMSKHAKNELLNYMTKCLGSLKVPIAGIARSVYCHYHWIQNL